MKKRILSIVLCLVMVMGLLPMQAHAEEGSECAHCSHYHYGDYVCSGCGLCSSECSNSDCWYETHCKNCGGCYMGADDWCDECGWCDECMQEAHCLDCKRCFVGESKDELCEDCQRCTYCVEDNFVCEECRKCVDCGDDYDHCQSCHKHLEGGEVCGYCDECAEEEGLHCEECGGCFETEVDHCPIHEDDNHCERCAGFVCEECGECKFTNPDLELCDDCGLCKDCCSEVSMSEGCSTGEVCVESSDWLNHFCSDCGDCACVITICESCGKCANCCAKSECSCGCTCEQTEISYNHEHKYRKGIYKSDAGGHWQICLICKEESTHNEHACTAASSVCQVCGWDTEKTLFFVIQPKDAVAKVSYDGAPEGSADHPAKNTVTFSVTAVNQAGKELQFQWYEVCKDKKTGGVIDGKMLMDGGERIVVSGAKTNRLTVSVPIDACFYNYEYYCVVTSEDASGTVIQEKSNSAKLRAKHNYSAELKCLDTPKLVAIEYRDQYENPSGKEYYRQGSKYHNNECLGLHCGRTKLPAKTRHNFVFKKYLGYGFHVSDTLRPNTEYYYFYLWECKDCHYVELRESATELSEKDFSYSITIEDSPDDAYIMDSDDNVGITVAKAGDRLYAIASPTNAAGRAFKEWQVVSGPEGFTVSQYSDLGGIVPGCGTFEMPNGNVALKAVYSEKQAISSVRIKKVGNAQPVNGNLTVHVGDVFSMDTILTPSENLENKNIVWDVLHYNSADSANPQLVFKAEQQAGKETSSKPIEGAVTLEAKVTGAVWLRAATQESAGQVKDVITVRVLPSNTTADGHTHSFDGGTQVQPTCTKSGYTVYKCTGEGCEYQYQADFKNPTGHKDTNDDGRCDNLKRDGTRCDYQMANDGNTSMVGLTKIEKVELTVAAPVRGGVPATTATPTGAEKDYYSASAIMWFPDVNAPDTFASGTPYAVLIKLEANDNYGFKLNGIIDSNNTQFYINGNKATVVYRDSQEASITYEFPATATSHSGSGSSTGSTAYTVTVLDSKNGAVTADRKSASAGSTVKLTVSPDKGYTLETLTVLDKNGKQIKCTEKNGRYTFTMPAGNVTVKATFMDDNTMLNFFVDVKAGDYYYDAVLWAAENGITGGTDATHFTPGGICTRAQAVTFLWRAAGSPAPKSADMPFTDVLRGSYYETAVLWAVENGITRGTSDTTFSPEETCTRAQIVTFLWRSRKSPAAGSANPFTDVKSDAYYTDAVLWAVKESVTSGTTAATFSPDENCTRAQIVTFIYRALAK